MKLHYKMKSAFTMLELVMVIVVLGILAALAIPRMDRDIQQEAADNILSAIRYTQHLALMDDKTDPFDGSWQQKLWAIRFSHYTKDGDRYYFYTIGTNEDKSAGIAKSETAIDPANGKYLYHLNTETEIQTGESPNLFIGKKFGINSFSHTGGCSNAQHIAFDNFGRAHNGIGGASNKYEKYMKTDCNLTFGFAGGEDNVSIIIEKETGYAYIDGQPDS